MKNMNLYRFLTRALLMMSAISLQASSDGITGWIKVYNKTNGNLDVDIQTPIGSRADLIKPEGNPVGIGTSGQGIATVRWNTVGALGVKGPVYKEQFNFSGHTHIFIFKNGLFAIYSFNDKRGFIGKTFKEIDLDLVGKEIGRKTHDQQSFERALKKVYPFKNIQELMSSMIKDIR